MGKREEKPASSWIPSPKYEKLNEMKERIKARQAEQKRPEIKLLDIKPPVTNEITEVGKNSFADLRFDAIMQRAPTTQIYNRNLQYEEKLKILKDNMLEVIEKMPDPDECQQKLADFKMPSGLRVQLLPHQVYSMQWLKWREKTYPNGSILADDMGLGKTLTILAYLKFIKVFFANFSYINYFNGWLIKNENFFLIFIF